MSNKLNSFESKEMQIKSSMNKPIMRPISNIIPTNKIPKDNQTQFPSKNSNGLVNKILQKPPNLNLYKNSNLETKRNLKNSKSNVHLNMLEEDLKKTNYAMEINKAVVFSKRENSKNSILNENENISAFTKNSKEPLINFCDSYNTYNPNQSRKELQNKLLNVESKRKLVDKSIGLLNNKQNINFDSNSCYLNFDENETCFNDLVQTNRNFMQEAKKVDKDLYNTFSNPNIGNFYQNSNNYNNENLIVRKPVANNLSMNLVNNKNICLKSIHNKNSFNKNSFNNSNFTGVNNYQLNNNNNSTNKNTMLRGGFIMGAMDKKIHRAEFFNNNNNNPENILLNTLNYNTYKNLNQNKNVLESRNPAIQNYNSYKINSSKSISNIDLKFVNDYAHKDSQLILPESQTNYIHRNTYKSKKNRSASFNNLKFRCHSVKYNHKRPKSQTFNELTNNNAIQDFESDYCSLDKKNSLNIYQKKLSNLNDDYKSLSILDLKKRYNEVVKKKKIPTSLLIKSIKSSVDKRITNNTISHYDKNLILENTFLINNRTKNILKPVAPNNLYLKKNSFNFSNTNDLTISEFPIDKLKKQSASINSINNNFDELKNKFIIKDITELRTEDDFFGKNPNKTIELKNNKNDLFKGTKTISREKRILAVNKESENKVKLRNRIYNEDKFATNLYNPKKKSTKKDLLNMNKNYKNNNSNRNEFLGFNTDNENERLVFNNFDNSIVPNGDLTSKRLRAKNKSFANTNLNWNNLIFTNKSQNLLARNALNNKSNYRSKIPTIHNLLKLQLQSMEVELKNQTTKNLNFNKKSFDVNADNNEGSKANFDGNRKIVNPNPINFNKNNFANNFNNNSNNNLLLLKNKFEGQKKVINKSILNSELINELQNYLKNQKEKKEAIINLNNNTKKIDNELSSSRQQSNRAVDNVTVIDKNNKHTKNPNQNLFVKDSKSESECSLKNNNNNNYQKDDANNSIKSINLTNNSNQNENIRILENDSDIILNETSRYNKLNNTDVNARNLNTNSNKLNNNFDSEASGCEILEERKSNHSNIQSSNQNIINKSIREYSIKQIKETISKNKSFSNCSQHEDDIEDMNTIIKKLNFAKNTKNEDSIFNLNNKVYNEFNLKFKNEIESYMFPQKNNQINSVGKRNDSNSKSHVSTEETSSKKKISPNDYKSNLIEGVLDTGREKINLYNVHLSKI